MRIGLLIYGDIEAVSGGYLYDRKLVEYLRLRGEQVVIFSLPFRGYWRNLADNLGDELLRQIADAKLDILIQDAMVQPSVVALNRCLSLPVVALVHLLTSFERHNDYCARFYRMLESRYLQTTSGLIANSQTTLDQLGQLLRGQLPAHCVALPASDHFDASMVDADFVTRRALSRGPLNILMVGNVIRRKGLHVLLDAMRRLPAEQYRLSVVGRLDMQPDYVRQIRRMIGNRGLSDRVSLYGPMQGEALIALYLQHQLMALPSAYESYGIVYAEALQCGMPAIGTKIGAAGEVIRHGHNGYLINPEDSHELAALLRLWNEDRELLALLSRNALASVIGLPKWSDSCEIIRRFLSRLAGQTEASLTENLDTSISPDVLKLNS